MAYITANSCVAKAQECMRWPSSIALSIFCFMHQNVQPLQIPAAYLLIHTPRLHHRDARSPLHYRAFSVLRQGPPVVGCMIKAPSLTCSLPHLLSEGAKAAGTDPEGARGGGGWEWGGYGGGKGGTRGRRGGSWIEVRQ